MKNPLVQQYVLELLLPILGYFFFDWSILIIVAFYYFDYLGAESNKFRRLKKVHEFHQTKFQFLRILLIQSVFLFSSLFSAWYLVANVYSGFLPTGENDLKDFLIGEGWILLPLVIFAHAMKDQFAFYMTRKFTFFHPKNMLKFQMMESFVLALLTIAGVFVWLHFEINDYIFLLLFILLKLLFDFGFSAKIDKLSKA